jgi:rhamnosyltransferase
MNADMNAPAASARVDEAQRPPLPRVAVLLATHNGLPYVTTQLESILRQSSCVVTVWVSDDLSTDGTWEWMCEQALREPRVKLLPRTNRFGNAARNFYRLIQDADTSTCDYVALSDQDDIWFEDKLARSIACMRALLVDAVSSNVIALWPDGRRKLVRKSQHQRKFDFLFSSAGPGCTYIFSAACLARFGSFLASRRALVDTVQFHDWMLYAWVRSNGFKWHIEAEPTMLYRQHGKNEYGVNSGLKALRRRLSQVFSGWYREQILRISSLVSDGSAYSAECVATIRLVERATFRSRMCLALRVAELRRERKERALLFLACLFGAI